MKPRREPTRGTGHPNTGRLATVAIMSLLVGRCAGPLLVSAVGVGITGRLLGNWWLVTVAAVVALAAVGHVLLCRTRRLRGTASPDDCCPTLSLHGEADRTSPTSTRSG